MRIKPALAHRLGDFGKMAAGLLGDGFTGDAGAELVRLEKNIAEDFEVARLVKRRQGDFVRARGGVVEIGVDADDVHVAHDQQRRIFKVGAVFEKLVIGGVEIFLFTLIFPAEEIFFPDIRPAVAAAVLGRAFFKSEGLAGRVSRSGLGMADEFAKIKEMLLGGGAFRQVNLAPLGDKFLGGHGSVVNSAGFSRIGMAGSLRGKFGSVNSAFISG